LRKKEHRDIQERAGEKFLFKYEEDFFLVIGVLSN